MHIIGTSDLEVFPLALGGNTFGWTSDEPASHRILDAFTEQGGNFVDTADGYSAWVPGHHGGESETIIGSWLRARGHRDDVLIGTKVSQHPDFRGLSASTVAAAAGASLQRLGTDRIDIYFAHYDDADTPLVETAAAFDALVRAGDVRSIGLSNYSAARIAEWFTIAEREGLTLPVALQPHYNLVQRDHYETELAPIVARYGLGVMPYYALAAGFLTGKYRTRADLTGKAREKMAGRYFSEQGLEVIRALETVAADHDASLASTAIAWLAARPGVVAPIASASRIEQLPDLLAAATLELTAEDLDALDGVSSLIAD